MSLRQRQKKKTRLVWILLSNSSGHSFTTQEIIHIWIQHTPMSWTQRKRFYSHQMYVSDQNAKSHWYFHTRTIVCRISTITNWIQTNAVGQLNPVSIRKMNYSREFVTAKAIHDKNSSNLHKLQFRVHCALTICATRKLSAEQNRFHVEWVNERRVFYDRNNKTLKVSENRTTCARACIYI